MPFNIFRSFRSRSAPPEAPVAPLAAPRARATTRRPELPSSEAAHVEAQRVLLEAQQSALELRKRVDDEIRRERDQLHALDRKLTEREDRVAQKLDALEQKALRLQERVAEVNVKEAALHDERTRLQRALEEVASLTQQEAAARVLAVAEEGAKGDIVRRVRKLESQGREDLEKKAHLLLASVIQRYAAPHVAETSTTGVHLPNDEIKGRIIGKEGRNIRALEAATGCDIIVDETPGTIVVSGFNPLRREVAKRALERLVADGRIQPARIEDVVASVKKEIAEEIRAAGEEVCYDLGITDFPSPLVQLIGRLKYRTSYGQSILQHSWEAARIGTMLAEELKADVNVVKRAVLLHDVGKAVDHEVEGTHVEIGDEIMKKYGVPDTIRKAAAAHHEDYPYETVEAIIVQISDAISAARPGARRESYEEYVKRLSELEDVATSFEGVEKAYAIAAGREVRVFVEPKKVDDLQALRLAQGIAAKIETELKYPGEVKVNVIRETRAEATAR